MNPAGTTTGVVVGVATLEVTDGAGVGTAAGVSAEKRFTRMIAAATAMTTAAMASVASPRRLPVAVLVSSRLDFGRDRHLRRTRR